MKLAKSSNTPCLAQGYTERTLSAAKCVYWLSLPRCVGREFSLNISRASRVRLFGSWIRCLKKSEFKLRQKQPIISGSSRVINKSLTLPIWRSKG
jgi:hypothetical protein